MRQTRHGEARPTWLERLRGYVWGYDFFISYQWKTGGRYAVALAEALRDQGFDCFLDRSEFAAGDDWRAEARAALWATQQLVVVGTRGALADSPAVAHEIELFRGRRRRVIVVVFGARLTDEERRALPTYNLIPAGEIDVLEPAPEIEGRPSPAVIAQIAQAHRVLRRRALRVRLIQSAFATLGVLLVLAIGFGAFGWVERNNERRQRMLATAEAEVNRANLWRETQGRKLEESLHEAASAYRNAAVAGADASATVARAREAIAAALAIRPRPLGDPLAPFGESTAFHMQAVDDVLIVAPDLDDGRSPVSVAVRFEPQPGTLRTLCAIDRAQSGAPVQMPCFGERRRCDGTRWVATTGEAGRTRIWDATTCRQRGVLPAGNDLLALAGSAPVALTRAGDHLFRWDFGGDPSATSADFVGSAARASYVLSPTGDWIVWAEQQDAGAARITPAHQAGPFHFPEVGDPIEGLWFAAHTAYDGQMVDDFVFFEWSANSVAQAVPSTGPDEPSDQAAGRTLMPWYVEDPKAAPMMIPPIVRANDFRLVQGSSGRPIVAVIDPQSPLQVIEPESQLSTTLGAAAGPAVSGAFSPGATLVDGCDEGLQRCLFVAAHVDGTARVWDLPRRTEILRLTADENLVDAGFLLGSTSDGPMLQAIVTKDGRGRLQAWAPARSDTTVDAFLTPHSAH
jgi:hypothetical protein